MTMTRKKLTWTMVLSMVLALGLIAPATADQHYGPYVENGNVRICDRTRAVNNPYVSNSPSVSSVDGPNSTHAQHDGDVFNPAIHNNRNKTWGDIIPPIPGFDSGDGEGLGKNWTADGQDIWNNGCQVPGQEPGPSVSISHVTGEVCGEASITVTVGEGTPEDWQYGVTAAVGSRQTSNLQVGPGSDTINILPSEDQGDGEVTVRYWVTDATEWDIVPEDLQYDAEIGDTYVEFAIDTDCDTPDPEPSVDISHVTGEVCGEASITVTVGEGTPEGWQYGVTAAVGGRQTSNLQVGPGSDTINILPAEDQGDGEVTVRYWVTDATEWDIVPEDLQYDAEIGDTYVEFAIDTDCDTPNTPTTTTTTVPPEPETFDVTFVKDWAGDVSSGNNEGTTVDISGVTVEFTVELNGEELEDTFAPGDVLEVERGDHVVITGETHSPLDDEGQCQSVAALDAARNIRADETLTVINSVDCADVLAEVIEKPEEKPVPEPKTEVLAEVEELPETGASAVLLTLMGLLSIGVGGGMIGTRKRS